MVSLFYGDMKHTACRNGKGNSLFGCLYTVKGLNANRLRRFKGVLILHMAGYDLGFDLWKRSRLVWKTNTWFRI